MTQRHLPFYPSLIFAALVVGIGSGFASGAYMVWHLAFDQLMAINIVTIIQIHSHSQLLGWTGLMIIGVCLYKLPRLMSIKPLHKATTLCLIWAILIGLFARTLGQLLLATTPYNTLLRGSVSIGILLESLAILIFSATVLSKIIYYKASQGAIAAAAIRPFLLVSLFGWTSFAVSEATLALDFLFSSSTILNSQLNALSLDIYLFLVLIPTCLAFSLSVFPIFLRLRAPTWPVGIAALLYALGSSTAITATHISPQPLLLQLSLILRSAVVFWVVYEMDFLRLKAPWFRSYRQETERQHNPPRKHSADYGQFGNFHWLIYAAYFWLCLALVADLSSLMNVTAQSASIAKHLYLLGFVTHLILGVAPRMIPGFLGRSSVAYPQLVLASFVLLSTATVLRILPLCFELINLRFFRYGYGYSGLLAILALCCLGVNLAATVLAEKAKRLTKIKATSAAI